MAIIEHVKMLFNEIKKEWRNRHMHKFFHKDQGYRSIQLILYIINQQNLNNQSTGMIKEGVKKHWFRQALEERNTRF